MLDELNTVLTEEVDAIRDHIETCDCLLPKVETELNVADKAKSVDDHVINVIAAYRLSQTFKMLQPNVSDMENDVYTVNITFQPYTSLARVTTDVDRLGTLNIDRTPTAVVDLVSIDRTPTAEVDTKLTVAGPVRPGSDRKSLSDIDVPGGYYTGVAVMPNGQVVLVEYNSKNVILLDKHMAVQSTLALPNKPMDVAVDGAIDVIVSMHDSRQLQWLCVTPRLHIGRTIRTLMDRIRGVAVHGGCIYLSGYIGNRGNVHVLDWTGKVVRRIEVGMSGYVAVSARGDVYVSDLITSRIACYSNVGDEMYYITPSDMGKPSGMVVYDNCLTVCCQVSNNIQVLAKDDTRRKVMLSSADGVTKPIAVAYRQTDNTLIVTMSRTPNVRMYKLK